MAIQLRESEMDDQTTVFSLAVPKRRASQYRAYLEALVKLIDAYEDNGVTLENSAATRELPGNLLKRLRTEWGLSQKAMAQVVGVSQGRISDYEQGVREIPVDVAEKLAQHFHVQRGSFLD